MKIIHILHHSQLDYQKEIRCYNEDWHFRNAEQIVKRTSKYDIECWRPEIKVNKLISGEINGINFKIFPSKKIAGEEISSMMINMLNDYSKEYDVLIHLHGIHNWLSWAIMRKFKHLPIVGQQHGDASSLAHYKISKSPFRFLYYIPNIFELNALKNVDHFFVLTNYVKNELSNIVGFEKVETQTMGVDFNIFKPMIKDQARSLIHHNRNKKILLYVGRFFENKGILHLINAYHEIRKKSDVELLLIGGQKTDPCYKKAIESEASVLERIPGEQMIPYYCSSDVTFTFYLMNFWGGIGIAPVESLACNIPIVANTLIHFPTDEKRLLGEIPKDKNDIVPCITRILDDTDHYKECRKIAEKYYNWDKIIGNTINVYENLIEEYY